MRRSLYFAVILIGIAMSLTTACSKRDQVIGVEEKDPEMTAAIASARSTLGQFWQVFGKRERGEEKFALKVKITDKKGTEHFWVTEIERRDGKTFGTINNEPEIVSSVKMGDRIEIPEADISDWLYLRGGKMVGNETLKPLMKSMKPEEAARFKSMMADP